MSVLSFPFLSRGLYETSEGRYAQVAKTMVVTSNYLIPALNNAPHLTKPPLTYWIIALGLKIFGVNTFGTRFFHALAWILSGLLILRIGELISNLKRGIFAASVFATGLFSSLGSWFLTTDTLLVLWQTAAFWSFLEYQKKDQILIALLFWIFWGLALLTKGPVALLPLIFMIAFDKRNFLKISRSYLWIFAILIGLSWYITLELKWPGLLSKLIFEEIYLRSATDFSGRNSAWWAPLPIYILPILAASGFWLFGLKKNNKYEKHNIFFFYWIVISLIFFSIVQSRLTLYILPLTVPLSLLIALNLDEATFKKQILINGILIIILKIAGINFLYQDDAKAISLFIERYAPNQRVHFIFEKSLHGVEFYLGNRCLKTTPSKEIKSLIVYQKKRQDQFNSFLKSYNLHFHPLADFGKWKLVAVLPSSVEKKYGTYK